MWPVNKMGGKTLKKRTSYASMSCSFVLCGMDVSLEVKYVFLIMMTYTFMTLKVEYIFSICSCLQNNISWMLIRRQAPCQTLGTGHTPNLTLRRSQPHRKILSHQLMMCVWHQLLLNFINYNELRPMEVGATCSKVTLRLLSGT